MAEVGVNIIASCGPTRTPVLEKMLPETLLHWSWKTPFSSKAESTSTDSGLGRAMSANRNLFGQFNEESLELVKTTIEKGNEEGMVGKTVEANGRRETVESRRNLRRPNGRDISVQRETSVSDITLERDCLRWKRRLEARA